MQAAFDRKKFAAKQQKSKTNLVKTEFPDIL